MTLRGALRTLAPAAALLLAAPLAAQVVRGEVTRSGRESRPAAGALVVLLDSAGTQRGAALTGPDGAYVLRAPGPGTYTVRAEMVGLPSTTSPALRLAAGHTARQALELTGEVVGLAPLRAAAARGGRGACQVRPGTGEATALLWEEARKALNASNVTQQAELVRYDVVQYRRDLDTRSLAVKAEERSAVSKVVRTPFASIPAEELARGGFVQTKDDGTYYYGPDAAVLLSDVFLAGHCFEVRPTHPDDPALIGLAFRPSAARVARDVEGVLWLDLATSELRHLEYRYTGLPSGIETDRLGGRVEFERLPQGAWIVRKWWIRMPALARNTYTLRDYASAGVRSREQRDQLLGIREEGGEVVTAAQRERAAAGVGATLSGVVWDSLSNRPLSGASVFVSGTSLSAVTDSAGGYVLDGVGAGEHTIGFTHPIAQSFGVFPSRTVTVREGDAVGVDLAMPGGTALARALCGERYRQGVGVLAGVVTDAEGRPVKGAKVQARWWRRGSSVTSTRHDGMETETDERGVYGLCGVSPEMPLDVEVHSGGARRGEAEVRLADGAARRDFRVGAALVAAGDSARAVPVAGVTATARTEARGFAERRRAGNGRFLSRADIERLRAARFTDLFRGIPGVQVISGPGGDQVRASSAAPRRIASDMEGRSPVTGRPPVAPGAPPPTIDPDNGPGAIGKASADALAPGVSRTADEVGDCEIRYYVDGVYFPLSPGTSISGLLRPDDVDAIEIYTRASQVPPRYRVPGAECGVILVWTRRTVG